MIGRACESAAGGRILSEFDLLVLVLEEVDGVGSIRLGATKPVSVGAFKAHIYGDMLSYIKVSWLLH